MPTISEVRSKYPQYSDLSDKQLAEGLHKKYYSDLPFEDFAKRIGYSTAPPETVATIGGTGGMNPFLARLVGAGQKGNEELGITEENIKSPLNAVGPLETGLQMGTGLAGTVLGGLAGAGQGLKNLVSPGMPAADRVNQVQNAMTYQPRTGVGNASSRMAGLPFELYAKGTNYLGEKTTDLTGSPLLGAGVKTGGDIAPNLVGLKSLPKRGLKQTGEYTRAVDAVPTTEQLSAASREAYKRADDSGLAMSEASFEQLKADLSGELKKLGMNEKLHPKATAALEELEKHKGPITLQETEMLRRIANDAMDTPEAADQLRAGTIVDRLDEYVDNVSDVDVVGGDKAGASALKEARALYTRKRKTEDIDRLIERAKLAPSGFENGLRIEFRNLVKNDRKFKRFSKEEQEAIRKVATGGNIASLTNLSKLVGKAAPTGIVSAGIGSGLGALIGGPAGAAAVPAIGFGSRMLSERLTLGNAARAQELMRRGPTGGLLGGGEIPSPRGLLEVPKPRSAMEIRSDLLMLDEEVKRLKAMGPVADTVRASVEAEVARLRQELSASESQGGLL